jgi:hypothetical protein
MQLNFQPASNIDKTRRESFDVFFPKVSCKKTRKGILFNLGQVANVVFFKVTVYFLVEHWRNASTLTKSGENKGNFLIVVKLFFIMGESCDYYCWKFWREI